MQKNFGLEIARSIAIILVVIAHLSPFFKNNPVFFNLLYNSGLYGVELFFVLSGFLIGKTILTKLTPNFSFKEIINFYVRRLLRIMPLYFVVLVILVFIDNFIFGSKSLHLLHFVFLQNFFPNEVGFFAVSWTLSIQFWFYLIIPVIFMIINNAKYSSVKLLRTFIFIIILINFFRFIYIYLYNPIFDFGVRKNILLRFDSLFIGVLFAILKLRFKILYEKFSNFNSFAVSLIVLTVFYFYYVYLMVNYGINFFDRSILFRAFSWPLMSLGLIIFVVYLENNLFINKILINKKLIYYFFTKLSMFSFSIFLIHYEIYTYFENNLKFLNIFLSVITASSIILIISIMLYNLIERPMLLKKSNYK
ncbi:MAG: acyltransferase [Patescibacteria group bacterium]